MRANSETRLDSWVAQRPILTFSLAAFFSAGCFVVLYWLTGTVRINGGFELNDTVTGYVGYLVTTVVALAGSLVSLMLARLALKLGREAADVSKRATDIQDQMRKFDDPRLAETREGHKAAAALDLLGTLLCVYSSETFSANREGRPIEAIRHTYKRANDLVSDPSLYRYCAQLIGAAETARLFASAQVMIYDAARMLVDGEAGRKNFVATARNCEKIAIGIANLSRTVERQQRLVLDDADHPLHQLALDLEWANPSNRISGCEMTAYSNFLDVLSSMGVHDTVGVGQLSASPDSANSGAGVAALLRDGARSVVHVLETELDAVIGWIAGSPNADGVSFHESLRDYATAWSEGAVGEKADVIVARWDSTLNDSPESVAEEQVDRPPLDMVPNVGAESTVLWNKATYLANHPVLERTLDAALRDLSFLREMRVEDLSDDLIGRRGMDPDNIDEDTWAEEQHLASLSARRLRYIHAAIARLRKVHARNGAVLLPDRDPYAGMGKDFDGGAIIVIRPYFARIDMSVPNSPREHLDEWFLDRVARYDQYRWQGTA